MMVLKAIHLWMCKHVLQMLQEWIWLLVSHPAAAVAGHRPPTCSAKTTGSRGACKQEDGNHRIRSSLRENPTAMCHLSKKVYVGERESIWLPGTGFHVLSSACRQALFSQCQVSETGSQGQNGVFLRWSRMNRAKDLNTWTLTSNS